MAGRAAQQDVWGMAVAPLGQAHGQPAGAQPDVGLAGALRAPQIPGAAPAAQHRRFLHRCRGRSHHGAAAQGSSLNLNRTLSDLLPDVLPRNSVAVMAQRVCLSHRKFAVAPVTGCHECFLILITTSPLFLNQVKAPSPC